MHLLDTTLLIDLERSARNPRRQAAQRWLAQHRDEELAIPAVAFGEFAEGFEDPQHPTLLFYRSGFRIVPVDAQVALVYGELSRTMRARGEPIGANDTWIAATVLAVECPLVTRNARHFNRATGLEVVVYG